MIHGPAVGQEQILGQLPAAAAAQLRGALTSPQRTIDMFARNSGVFPFQTDDYKGLLRLDHRASERNNFIFRFNVTSSYDTNQNLSALVGLSAGVFARHCISNASSPGSIGRPSRSDGAAGVVCR